MYLSPVRSDVRTRFDWRRCEKGNAATVLCGPYAGDQLSVDHIIPRIVVPEMDSVIANLELTPLRMKEVKNAKIGTRQRELARKLHQAGCLSQKGLSMVLKKTY